MDLTALLGTVRNALWIVGLSLALAAVSHASWRASARSVGLLRELSGAAFLGPASAGLLLVTASLAWGADSSFDRWLWTAASIMLSLPVFDALRRAYPRDDSRR